MPYQRLAKAVLADWREVERELAAIGSDTAAAQPLRFLANELRDEYQSLIDEAIAHQRPEPPPFPGATVAGDRG